MPYMVLVMLPFWTSILVKSFAFGIVLGDNGIVNHSGRRLRQRPAPKVRADVQPRRRDHRHEQLPAAVHRVSDHGEPARAEPQPAARRRDHGRGPIRIFLRITLPLSCPACSPAC
jgi:ABC-type spermidine/putrescine transport system permease subunit I